MMSLRHTKTTKYDGRSSLNPVPARKQMFSKFYISCELAFLHGQPRMERDKRESIILSDEAGLDGTDG